MTYSPAEFLALLIAMTTDLPDRPDLRPQAQIDADMRHEQRAEDMAWMRAHPSDGDSEYASRRWAG